MLSGVGQVQAIRVSDVDIQEGQGQLQSSSDQQDSQVPRHPTLLATLGDEEVFLAQLHRRAMLLNRDFQDKIMDIVDSHAAQRRGEDGRPSVELDPATAMSRRVLAASCLANSRRQSDSHHLMVPEGATQVCCRFDGGESNVVVHMAPPKTVGRMREKMLEYAPPHPRGIWPLSANILDPVRTSIVCYGSDQVMQVARWFTEHEAKTGLVVCRLKNTFSADCDIQATGGYRDLKLFVLFEGKSGSRIIGEIQIHDMPLYLLKLKVCVRLDPLICLFPFISSLSNAFE